MSEKVEYEGQSSGDVFTSDELGFDPNGGDVREITMGNPDTGETELFRQLPQSVEEDVSDEASSSEIDEQSPSGIEENSNTDDLLPDDSENESDSDDGYTCVGKDGECSRSVDSEGDTCWQHGDGE